MGTEEKNTAHRPGLFKLPNKKHKTGQHRSKRAIARESGGRLGIQTQTFKKPKKVSKAQRKNQTQQLWARKQEQLLEKMRIHGPANNRASYVVTIISMDEKFDAEAVVKRFSNADPDSTLSETKWGRTILLSVPRMKAKFSFLCPDQVDLSEVLDCVRISEVVLLVWPLDCIISPIHSRLLTTIMSQGLPVSLHAVVGLPPNGKQRDHMRKILEKSMSQWPLLRDEKTHNFDSASDAQKFMRLISSVHKKPSILQQRHPHLLVDEIEFADENAETAVCTLKVTGFLRGAPLNINKPVHIQGFGDFSLSQVDKETQNRKIVSLIPKNPTTMPQMSEENNMEIDDQSMADLDGSDSSDLDEDEKEYGSESGDEEGSDMASMADYDETVSLAEEGISDALKTDDEGADRFRQERENAQWPDEVETPRDIPARERFINYRGLKSFRTSPWDPKENLPAEYSRIYKFCHFKYTKKNVLAEVRKAFLAFNNEATVTERSRKSSIASGQGDQRIDDVTTKPENEEIVFPGSHVTLHIASVPLEAKKQLLPNKTMILFGLLTHEEKMSVLNMVLEKHPLCRLPLKNRDSLVFQVGFRRFEAAPLFSQHNNGNKFKMERFAPAEGTFCASVLAPIIIPPATVLAFRRDAQNRLHIVASGNVLDLNPDRIVLKRVVLSGHPFKVNKRLAVVRYMFYNKEDVDWFKPLEVYTTKGRRGHIKESLGTHGLMKCLFDQPLTTQDSVLLNLYKRVFPKLSYTSRVPLTARVDDASNQSTVEAMEE